MYPPPIVLHHHQRWCLRHHIFFYYKPKASYMTYPSYTELSYTTLFWNSLYMVCSLGPSTHAFLVIGDLELLVLHSQVLRRVRDILEGKGEQLEFICHCYGTLTRISQEEEEDRRRCCRPALQSPPPVPTFLQHALPLPPCIITLSPPPCQRSCHHDYPCFPPLPPGLPSLYGAGPPLPALRPLPAGPLPPATPALPCGEACHS